LETIIMAGRVVMTTWVEIPSIDLKRQNGGASQSAAVLSFQINRRFVYAVNGWV
jgi:hypothetical protein